MNIDATTSPPSKRGANQEASCWTPPPHVRNGVVHHSRSPPPLLSPPAQPTSLEQELQNLKLMFLQEYHKPRGTPERRDKLKRLLAEYSQKDAAFHLSPSSKTPTGPRDIATEEAKCQHRIRQLQKEHTLIYRLLLEQYDQPDSPTRRHILNGYTLQLREIDRDLSVLRVQQKETHRARLDHVQALKEQRVESERNAYFEVSLRKFHAEEGVVVHGMCSPLSGDSRSIQTTHDDALLLAAVHYASEHAASSTTVRNLNLEEFEYSSSSESANEDSDHGAGRNESKDDDGEINCACELFRSE